MPREKTLGMLKEDMARPSESNRQVRVSILEVFRKNEKRFVVVYTVNPFEMACELKKDFDSQEPGLYLQFVEICLMMH